MTPTDWPSYFLGVATVPLALVVVAALLVVAAWVVGDPGEIGCPWCATDYTNEFERIRRGRYWIHVRRRHRRLRRAYLVAYDAPGGGVAVAMRAAIRAHPGEAPDPRHPAARAERRAMQVEAADRD